MRYLRNAAAEKKNNNVWVTSKLLVSNAGLTQIDYSGLRQWIKERIFCSNKSD